MLNTLQLIFLYVMIIVKIVMHPCCKLHPSKKAGCICLDCGFLCGANEDTYQNHLKYTITSKLAQMYTMVQSLILLQNAITKLSILKVCIQDKAQHLLISRLFPSSMLMLTNGSRRVNKALCLVIEKLLISLKAKTFSQLKGNNKFFKNNFATDSDNCKILSLFNKYAIETVNSGVNNFILDLIVQKTFEHIIAEHVIPCRDRNKVISAHSYMIKRNFRKAIKCYQCINSNELSMHIAQAMHLKGGDFAMEQANEVLTKNINYNSESICDAIRFSYLAFTYMKSGDLDQSLTNYMRSIYILTKHNHRNTFYSLNIVKSIGMLYFTQRRYAESIQFYMIAGDIILNIENNQSPYLLEVYYMLCRVLYEYSDYTSSIQYGNKAISLMSATSYPLKEQAQLYKYLALSLVETKETVTSEKYIIKYLELSHVSNVDGRELTKIMKEIEIVGEYYENSAKIESAMRIYMAMRNMYNKEPDKRIADIVMKIGRLSKIVEQSSNSEKAFYDAAGIYFLLNDKANTQKAYTELLQVCPPNSALYSKYNNEFTQRMNKLNTLF